MTWKDARPFHVLADRGSPRARLFAELRQVERRIQEMTGAVAILETRRQQIVERLREKTVTA